MQPSDASLAELRDVLLETYAVNDAMNQHLLARLDRRAWRAELPGTNGNAGRTIAAIFAHLHNNRLSWLRYCAPHLRCPARLDPKRCTMQQTAAAHRKSAALCLRMLADALSTAPERKVRRFYRGWGRAWPAGGTMFAYMFSHEAHHRGQILMLAHQLGYRLRVEEAAGIWQWDRLWKEQGFKTRPR
ncbi:MAG TPA: DinB family protein [Bryobacteraceae bacterium]|nr:DinB family protein [Bryobacteraceae bacterium]